MLITIQYDVGKVQQSCDTFESCVGILALGRHKRSDRNPEESPCPPELIHLLRDADRFPHKQLQALIDILCQRHIKCPCQ